jgi:ABC-type transport system substrate-binding protein
MFTSSYRLRLTWVGVSLLAIASVLGACGGTETVVERVVETVIVEKEKIVEVEKEVEKIVEKVTEKEVPVTVITVATPTAAPAAPAVTSSGKLTAAISNVYFMNSSPMYCPACSVQARTGATEFLLQAVRDSSGQVGIAPMLATEWSQSADGTSYTDFTIREGIQFHDGYGEMTAEDVAFTWNSANPNLTEGSVHDTGGAIGNIMENVEVTGDYSVRFNWKTFNGSTMLAYMTNFDEGIGILSKALFDEIGDEGMREKLVGTGPLHMDKWVQHEGAFLTAVPDHWRKTSYVEEVEILEVPEGATRKAMLETGQAAIVGNIALKDWADLLGKGIKIAPEQKLGDSAFTFAGNFWETELGASMDGTAFNSSEAGDLLYLPVLEDLPWIGDPSNPTKHESARKVRHAMVMAIDKQALVDILTGGYGVVSHQPAIKLSDPLWDDKWAIKYDPDAARALLAEAGHADGFDVEMWGGPAVATDDTIHEAVAAMWLKELNINTSIDQQNYSSFRPTLVNRTNTKILFSGGAAHTPVTWPKDMHASSLTRPGGYNRAIEIPMFRDTYEKMSTETDGPTLEGFVKEMYDWNTEWMVWAGIYQSPSAALYDPNQVDSWEMAPEGKGVLGMMNSIEHVKLK